MAMSCGAAARTSAPVVPSITSSLLPPTHVATTGNAQAMASRTVLDIPSASDGRTKISSVRISSATSSRAPGSQASCANPAAASTACTSRRTGPTPPNTRHARIRRRKPRRQQWRTLAARGIKVLRVDAVVDLRDLGRRHSDVLAQIAFEITRQRDITLHQRAEDAAQPTVLAIAAVEVVHIAAMLAMHPGGNTGEQRDELRLQRREIATVQQLRPQCPQQAPQLHEHGDVVTLALVERVQRHRVMANALMKIGVNGETDDGVAILRHAVDEIHEAILEAADGETEDTVRNERPTVIGGGRRAACGHARRHRSPVSRPLAGEGRRAALIHGQHSPGWRRSPAPSR